MTDATLVGRYRRFLLAVAAALFAATPAELVLAEHYGDWKQWMPFALCALGLAAVGWVWRRPRRGSVNALRGTMLTVAVGSAVGVFLHLRANYLFERDIRPAASAGQVLWEALFGASPLLAPGILVLAAVLAWAATLAHPALLPRRDA